MNPTVTTKTGVNRPVHRQTLITDTHASLPLRPSTLAQARELLAEDDRGKWDALIARRSLALKDGLLALPEGATQQERRLWLSRRAQGQMCARLGIPATYFASCPSILQDVQTNYWLKQKQDAGGTWRLRAKGNTVRAILSEKYSPLDNARLLDTLMPLLDHSRYRPDWFSLADDGLHLRLVDRGKRKEIRPDDELSVGVHLRNSEVGASSLTVDALVFRQVCSNGLIALAKGKSLLQQRHIHLSEPRFVAALEEALAQALQTAETFLDDLADTLEHRIHEPAQTLETLARTWHLGEPALERALKALKREEDTVQYSAYGLINALTEAAQLLPDEKRYDLEVMAGRLVNHGIPAFALAPIERHREHGENTVRQTVASAYVSGGAR